VNAQDQRLDPWPAFRSALGRGGARRGATADAPRRDWVLSPATYVRCRCWADAPSRRALDLLTGPVATVEEHFPPRAGVRRPCLRACRKSRNPRPAIFRSRTIVSPPPPMSTILFVTPQRRGSQPWPGSGKTGLSGDLGRDDGRLLSPSGFLRRNVEASPSRPMGRLSCSDFQRSRGCFCRSGGRKPSARPGGRRPLAQPCSVPPGRAWTSSGAHGADWALRLRVIGGLLPPGCARSGSITPSPKPLERVRTWPWGEGPYLTARHSQPRVPGGQALPRFFRRDEGVGRLCESDPVDHPGVQPYHHERSMASRFADLPAGKLLSARRVPIARWVRFGHRLLVTALGSKSDYPHTYRPCSRKRP